MIEQSAPTPRAIPPMHPIECHRGVYRTSQRISNVLPSQGYTAWCRSCKIVELVTWDQMPDDVLHDIVEAISGVLVVRSDAGV